VVTLAAAVYLYRQMAMVRPLVMAAQRKVRFL
jgi:hypothetical protein